MKIPNLILTCLWLWNLTPWPVVDSRFLVKRDIDLRIWYDFSDFLIFNHVINVSIAPSITRLYWHLKGARGIRAGMTRYRVIMTCHHAQWRARTWALNPSVFPVSLLHSTSSSVLHLVPTITALQRKLTLFTLMTPICALKLQCFSFSCPMYSVTIYTHNKTCTVALCPILAFDNPNNKHCLMF